MKLDDDHFIEYPSDSNLIELVESIRKKIQKFIDDGFEVDLIGHSLGGVISIILVQTGLNVRSVTTLSAPFGGITNNFLLRFWFPKSIFTEFFKLEMKYSHLLDEPIKIPHLFFVSTRGSNPFFLGKANDGVVSIESQLALDTSNYKQISTTHYEILMDQDVAHSINSFHKSL